MPSVSRYLVQTPCSSCAYKFAKDTAGGVGTTHLWLNGTKASEPAIAMAHALAGDSVDMTDGLEETQGHCGVAVVPSAFAFARSGNGVVSGQELLEAIIVGYEIGLRAGVRLLQLQKDLSDSLPEPPPAAWNKICHSTSGAWNAIGAAAASARLLQLSRGQIREALGIAEYYAPRSMMMRCIEYPTMLKDGAGFGAYSGTSAAILAKSGFTGAPAEIIDENEPWDSLGSRFMLNEQYFKKFAVCHWAQGAVQGAIVCLGKLGLKSSINTANQVKSIRIETFEKAYHMNHPHPDTTEIAQYSLPFAVAVAVVYGHVGAEEVTNLQNKVMIELSSKIIVTEKPEYTRIHPAEGVADVEIEMIDGRVEKVWRVAPPWTNKEPPDGDEISSKFLSNAKQGMADARADMLCSDLMNLENLTSEKVEKLLNLLEKNPRAI